MTPRNKITKTPYGRVTRDPYGGVTIKATKTQTWEWANKPGAREICSELSGNAVWACFDRRGDLVDISENALDVHADEFNAWAHDCLNWKEDDNV